MSQREIHTLQIRVRLEEVDLLGVVWHGHYATYFQMGRLEWAREIFGTPTLVDPAEMAIVVRKIEIEYHKPALYDQLITVHTQLRSYNKAILLFSQEVRCDEALLATAETTLICLDSQKRIQSFPQTLRNRLPPNKGK